MGVGRSPLRVAAGLLVRGSVLPGLGAASSDGRGADAFGRGGWFSAGGCGTAALFDGRAVFSRSGRAALAFLFGRGGVFSAGGRGTALLLACSGERALLFAGRATLLFGCAALFAVFGRAAFSPLFGCAALFAVFGRAAFSPLGAGPRVAGVFTVAFVALTTPRSRKAAGFGVAAISGRP